MEIKNASTIDSKEQIMVDNFTKDTGDFIGLSLVDRQVIALGVSISKQKNEFEKVRKEPLGLSEFKPKSFSKFYDDQPVDSSDEETKAESEPAGDGFEVTKGGRRGLKERDVKKYKPLEEQKEEEVKAVAVPDSSSDDEDKFDNEEDGGEWVTDTNLYSHLSGGTSQNLMENLDNLLFT